MPFDVNVAVPAREHAKVVEQLHLWNGNKLHEEQGYLQSRAVYAVPEKGKLIAMLLQVLCSEESTQNYYAWLRDSEIDHYSTVGESTLNDWLVTATAKMQKQTNGIGPTSTQCEQSVEPTEQSIVSERQIPATNASSGLLHAQMHIPRSIAQSGSTRRAPNTL
eukprot:2669076-Amphidinium_carterae.1